MAESTVTTATNETTTQEDYLNSIPYWNLHGRRVLYTDEPVITSDNVVAVLKKALFDHTTNATEIDYLWNYYKGDQPILHRTKKYNTSVCNKIVENHAQEIVDFKTAYLVGEPIQYVLHKSDEAMSNQVSILNGYMASEGKSALDRKMSDWVHICGTSYRIALPDAEAGDDDDESPFVLYNLDPRTSFIIYWSGLGHKKMLGVTYVVREDKTTIYTAYSKDTCYTIQDDNIISEVPHILGEIPIIEYPLNEARMGAFEVVLPLLDALNNISSNRMDGIEQFIQAFLLFHNVDVDTTLLAQLKELGALKISDASSDKPADVRYISQELNQQQVQSFKDDLYKMVLVICGMPNRNGGSSTSDTGSAVIYRDGWSNAEAKAKGTEEMWILSDKSLLKLVISICNELRNMGLKPGNVYPHFTRRNYENTQVKSQVLTTMLASDKIHPQLAFESCGLFPDPIDAYKMSAKYKDEQTAKAQALVQSQTNSVDTSTQNTNGGTSA